MCIEEQKKESSLGSEDVSVDSPKLKKINEEIQNLENDCSEDEYNGSDISPVEKDSEKHY